MNSNMIDKTIKDMKSGKIPSSSGVTTEILKISGKVGYGPVTYKVR